jgi:hypothetical protein
VADHPLRPATRRRLGEPLPHQPADRPQAPPRAMAFLKRPPFPHDSLESRGSCGISPGFPGLSPAQGQVAYVLRTRPPVGSEVLRRAPPSSLDLHVLSTPPAFVLSQDQTLHEFIPRISLSASFRTTLSNRPESLAAFSEPSRKDAVPHESQGPHEQTPRLSINGSAYDARPR